MADAIICVPRYQLVLPQIPAVSDGNAWADCSCLDESDAQLLAEKVSDPPFFSPITQPESTDALRAVLNSTVQPTRVAISYGWEKPMQSRLALVLGIASLPCLVGSTSAQS